MGLCFIGMVLLFAFSRLVIAKNPSINFAGVILLWNVLVFFVVFLTFTVTAFAALWPLPWVDLLGIHHDSESDTKPRTTNERQEPVVEDRISLILKNIIWDAKQEPLQFNHDIQTPIPIQTVAALNAAFPLEVLLPLLLSSMDFQAPNGLRSRIENSGEDRYKFRLFNSAIRQLVNHGLSTEPLNQPVGPLIRGSALGTPRAISDAATAGLTM